MTTAMVKPEPLGMMVVLCIRSVVADIQHNVPRKQEINKFFYDRFLKVFLGHVGHMRLSRVSTPVVGFVPLAVG